MWLWLHFISVFLPRLEIRVPGRVGQHKQSNVFSPFGRVVLADVALTSFDGNGVHLLLSLFLFPQPQSLSIGRASWDNKCLLSYQNWAVRFVTLVATFH